MGILAPFLMLLVSAVPALAAATPSAVQIRERVQQSLKQTRNLKGFYERISTEFGSKAVAPLLEIARDPNERDETRWACLFALARLTGKESVGVIRKLMTDRSWMLRDAALKTAAALHARELEPEIAARLEDQALIVRTTAVDTISHMRLTTLAPKLVDSLFDPQNYHGGRPLWIQKHILEALKELRFAAAVPRLVSLLEDNKDSTLRAQIVRTLEWLTGKSFPNRSIEEQVYLWKRNTMADRTF